MDLSDRDREIAQRIQYGFFAAVAVFGVGMWVGDPNKLGLSTLGRLLLAVGGAAMVAVGVAAIRWRAEFGAWDRSLKPRWLRSSPADHRFGSILFGSFGVVFGAVLVIAAIVEPAAFRG